MLKNLIANIFLDTEIKNDVLFLKNIDFFKMFTLWQLKKFITIVYKKTYSKNEVIYNKGEEAKLFCVLKNGRVELSDQKNKTIIEKNNVFGQKFLLCGNEVYYDTAKTAEKSEIYIFHKYDLETLMEKDAKIGFKISKMLLDNLYNRV